MDRRPPFADCISLVVNYNADVDDDDDKLKMMAVVSVCLAAKVATLGRQVESVFRCSSQLMHGPSVTA